MTANDAQNTEFTPLDDRMATVSGFLEAVGFEWEPAGGEYQRDGEAFVTVSFYRGQALVSIFTELGNVSMEIDLGALNVERWAVDQWDAERRFRNEITAGTRADAR